MERYVRKRNTFEELCVKESATSEEVINFFGTALDTRYTCQGGEFDQTGAFGAVISIRKTPPQAKPASSNAGSTTTTAPNDNQTA